MTYWRACLWVFRTWGPRGDETWQGELAGLHVSPGLSVFSSCSCKGAPWPWPCHLPESKPALWALPLPGRCCCTHTWSDLDCQVLAVASVGPQESTQRPQVCVCPELWQTSGYSERFPEHSSYVLCGPTTQLKWSHFFTASQCQLAVLQQEVCAGPSWRPACKLLQKSTHTPGEVCRREDTWGWEVGYPSRSGVGVQGWWQPQVHR